ncbi:MAG: hypothetical protein LBR49_06465 [Tannerella sp.]|jgi:hypothetical protein|nr:hypothetical protein [Tannerella sp.]
MRSIYSTIICVAVTIEAAIAGGNPNATIKATNGNEPASEEFKREIVKDFSVGDEPMLNIENKYGNIRIIEGVEGKISFRIEIVGKGRTSSLAKEYAEKVSVDFLQSGDRVSAETNFESLSCSNCGRTVHYTVLAPRSTILKLTNKYGNIILDDAEKEVVGIDLKYGNLTAHSIDNLNLDIAYGNIDITKCNAVNADTKYSVIKIASAETILMDSKYDKITLGNVGNIKLETSYTTVNIATLGKRMECEDIKYGQLNISEVAGDFESIKVSSSYTNIKIALSDHSFKAKLSVNYGEIKTPNSMKFTNVSVKDKNNLEGEIGSNPSATVEISAKYGNISL